MCLRLDLGEERPTPGPSRTPEGRRNKKSELGDTPHPKGTRPAGEDPCTPLGRPSSQKKEASAIVARLLPGFLDSVIYPLWPLVASKPSGFGFTHIPSEPCTEHYERNSYAEGPQHEDQTLGWHTCYWHAAYFCWWRCCWRAASGFRCYFHNTSVGWYSRYLCRTHWYARGSW